MVERVGVDDAGVDDGSSGRIDRTRGGRWLWLRRAAATVAFGRARERDRGEEEHWESEREPEGLRGALRQLQTVGGKQEVASYGRVCVGHTLCVRLARGGRRLCPWWAGPAYWAAR